jgi:hypothetical protein
MRPRTAVISCCLVTMLMGAVTLQGAAAPKEGSEAALTNDEVIKLCHSGLSDEIVIAKINQAPRVAFKLETDDLVRLKAQKVSDAVVSAMLSRTTPQTTAGTGQGARPNVEVRLATKEGELELKSMAGTLTATYAYIKMMHYMDYPGVTAKVRIRDRRPSVLLATDSDPRNRYFVVKTESNPKDNNRSVKIGSGGMFKQKGLNVPDEDWVVAYDAKEERSGVWRLTLKEDLPPGEYGVYRDGNLFEFGED